MNTAIGIGILSTIIFLLGISIVAVKRISKNNHRHHPQTH